MIVNKSKAKNLGQVNGLIIDDNMFDRRRFIRVAGETGLDFSIKESGDAAEFSAMLDQETFDVIFIDLNLGATDGMTLLPIVRAHSLNSNAAVIMVAGDSHAEVALKALREGFADYIEKEVLSPASLERATLNALQKNQLTSAAVSAEAATKTIENMLISFSQACSDEMRPLLARMVRQVRQVKSAAAAFDAADKVAEIEQTCVRIDEFFQDLSGLGKDGQLTAFVKAGLKDTPQPKIQASISAKTLEKSRHERPSPR